MNEEALKTHSVKTECFKLMLSSYYKKLGCGQYSGNEVFPADPSLHEFLLRHRVRVDFAAQLGSHA